MKPIVLLNLLFTTSLGQFQILYKIPLMDEQRFNSFYHFHAFEHIISDIPYSLLINQWFYSTSFWSMRAWFPCYMLSIVIYSISSVCAPWASLKCRPRPPTQISLVYIFQVHNDKHHCTSSCEKCRTVSRPDRHYYFIATLVLTERLLAEDRVVWLSG